MLEARDPVLYYVQRLRDEAHRFAIGTHRAKRSRRPSASIRWTKSPGIGPTRKKALLQSFGSAKAMSRAGVSDLAAVAGVSKQLAQAIYDHFHPDAREAEPMAVHMSRICKALPASKVWNLPNMLTYGRIVAVPLVAGLLLWTDRHRHDGPRCGNGALDGAGIYVVAAITDFFDGYLARKWEQQSALGKMLDPIADKVLVAVVLLVLCGDQILRGGHVWAAIIILAREVLVSGLREFLGQLRVSVPVTQIAKWKTTVQLVAIGFLIAGPAGDTADSRRHLDRHCWSCGLLRG